MFDCLLLMAGSGTRTTLGYNKIKYKINNKPLFMYSFEKFLQIKECNKIILVVKKEELDEYRNLENDKIKITVGGSTRFESVLNGSKEATSDIVLIHDAARPNVKVEDIKKVYEKAKETKSACLAVKAKDCIRSLENNETKTLERSNLWQIQTPQAVDRLLLIKGLESKKFNNYYDDCEVLEKNFNIKCGIVEGDYNNFKVTTDDDIKYMEFLMNNKQLYRIGHSKDTHRLVKNRKLILCGIDIPFELGLLGHSDADVVYHAIAESIIGALGLGDIGKFFPDNDPKYEGMDSSYFVKEVYKMMNKMGYIINNLDVTIYLEKPILKDHKQKMEENVAKLLHTDITNVNVKATRGEGLGYIGNMEGISAEAVCLLVRG